MEGQLVKVFLHNIFYISNTFVFSIVLLEKKKNQDEQLRNFVKSDHFRNRVTDMRLFYAGAAATEKE